MAVELKDNPLFYYVIYKKEDSSDLDKLKNILGNISGISTIIKDVAIDFTGSQYILSAEIGAVVRLMITLEKKKCKVMLIVSPEIKKFILTTNLQISSTLEIYEGHKPFFEMANKPREKLDNLAISSERNSRSGN